MKRTKQLITILTLILTTVTLTGCDSLSKTLQGTVIGAGAGALAGAVIGKAAGNSTTGAIVGAGVGGAAGAAIGNYMDRQSRELKEDLDGATVERVEEGIQIIFDSGILFDTNSYDLKQASKAEIEKLAKILQKYEDTDIMFSGHTDITGRKEYNQELSEKRATSVAEYAAQLGVEATRMTIVGFGIEKPIASNETVEGRAQNRRVEVAIWANEKLKKAAEKGQLD